MRAVIDVTKEELKNTSADRVLLTSSEFTPAEATSGVSVYGGEQLSPDTIFEQIINKGVEIKAIEIPSSLVTCLAGNDPQEIMYSALFAAMSSGEEISFIPTRTNELTNELKAKILKRAVELIPIEELYPNHPWSTHGEESLAAAYHTISAHLIKLKDYDGALEALSVSDRFEDSPRSLALRGVIAREKGETLAAVANMVSSLQQYEKRKVQTDNHYLSFTPKSFEDINSELKEGLDALNRKENETALTHFAKAVFQFDGFYKNQGLDELN
jgi:hypothetical protein